MCRAIAPAGGGLRGALWALVLVNLTLTLLGVLLAGSSRRLPEAPRPPRKGRLWAVVAGAGSGFATGARAVRSWFLTEAGLDAEDVFYLGEGGPRPTRRDYLEEGLTSWLSRRVQAGDTVVFYFAGNARWGPGGELYLLTGEAPPEEGGSLSARWVADRLAELPAATVLCWYDLDLPAQGAAPGKLSPQRGEIWIGSGSQPDSSSLRPFTRCLLAALQPERSLDFVAALLEGRLAAAGGGLTRLGRLPPGARLTGVFPERAPVPSEGGPAQNSQGIAMNSLAFSPDGSLLAAGSWDDTAWIWDTRSHQVVARLEGHRGHVESLAFHPREPLLATVSWDRTARLWDPRNGRSLELLTGHPGGATSVAFSPDGTRMATGSNDATVRIWKVATAELEALLEGHSAGVLCLAFHPREPWLASGGFDGTVRLWDLSRLQEMKLLGEGREEVVGLAVHPGGHLLAIARGLTVRFRELPSGRLLGSLGQLPAPVTSVAFSPDGRAVAVSSRDGTVRILRFPEGDVRRVLVGHRGWVGAVAFSPDGRRLASTGFDGTLRMWEASSGELEWMGSPGSLGTGLPR